MGDKCRTGDERIDAPAVADDGSAIAVPQTITKGLAEAERKAAAPCLSQPDAERQASGGDSQSHADLPAGHAAEGNPQPEAEDGSDAITQPDPARQGQANPVAQR